MADVAAETGDAQLLKALMRLYTDMTGKRIYVSRGIGPSAHNEGFTTDDGWWVNLYVRSRASLKGSGGAVLRQETDFPRSGTVRIRVEPASAQQQATLHLRIPAWSRKATLRLNSQPIQPQIEKGYAVLRRHWAKGDTLELDFATEVDRLEAPGVLKDQGKVALRLGPLIYCLEQADHAVDLDRLVLPGKARFSSRFERGLLGGVTVITATAIARPERNWETASTVRSTMIRARQWSCTLFRIAIGQTAGAAR